MRFHNTYWGFILCFDQRNWDLLRVIQTCYAFIVRRCHHVFVIIFFVVEWLADMASRPSSFEHSLRFQVYRFGKVWLFMWLLMLLLEMVTVMAQIDVSVAWWVNYAPCFYLSSLWVFNGWCIDDLNVILNAATALIFATIHHQPVDCLQRQLRISFRDQSLLLNHVRQLVTLAVWGWFGMVLSFSHCLCVCCTLMWLAVIKLHHLSFLANWFSTTLIALVLQTIDLGLRRVGSQMLDHCWRWFFLLRGQPSGFFLLTCVCQCRHIVD